MKAAAPPPGDKVSYLNFHYLKQVEAFVTSFRSYFLSSASGSQEGGMAGATDETAIDKVPVWTGRDARVQAGLSRDQVTLATAAIKEAVSKIISGYLDTIGSFLTYPVGENIISTNCCMYSLLPILIFAPRFHKFIIRMMF